MHTFFPEIKPYQRHIIAVEPPHELYVDESGNPDGIPVLFVHGGPGAGCGKFDRRFFDPQIYRIVLFDQRGAGRSRPHAELQTNSTQKLVEDIEFIRKTLGIDKWVLFGGSWGSTLSLVYAQTYPERVLGLILRGIFLCRPVDLLWFYQEGASRLFPDYWEDFIQPIPEEERHDMMNAYYRHLTGDNQIQQMTAAKAWSLWEGRTATLRPNQEVVESFTEPHRALSLARIEAHYFVNNAFLEENQILRDAHKLADIPGVIVHGRYDVICPLDNAYLLHKAWPGSELNIIREAGHASREAGIVDALIRATNDMAKDLGERPDQLA
ncbi:proline iminopeptidase [Cellvibrio zantedeschiae]|uniref:Proline iminopeptidase n=1 Tax=Cellvibrio zantedeschiae TaxID=1237077 RepID=A0ABQ3B9R8_9GAMM|nr:prolyl aminopeptidase [Cellvibrio zantedeschiae]GGY86468.1 proline iminopeptidase [Cellvibrio zantedeschiae]